MRGGDNIISLVFFFLGGEGGNKGEGDLTLDEKRVLILTAFFELEARNLVRSVSVGEYLIY